MPLTSAAVIGGSNILGGLIGSASASSDRDAANAARLAALQQFVSINVPDPAQQAVILQQFKSTGTLDPKLEQAFNQSQTELNNVQLDPTTRNAQLAALSKMQTISNADGLDAQAKSANQQSINQVNQNAKSSRDALIQSAAQRGTGGSGASLAAQLMASQQDANTASTQGMQNAASAQQRALQALSSGATLAGNINSSDYSQAAAKAQAQDAINKFNTQNSQSVANANTTTSNNAQATNLAASQAISNANTGIANTQETTNKALIQQQYQNELNKAAGASGQYGQVANQDTANANATAAQWAGIGSAIGQSTAAYNTFKNNQSDDSDDSDDESEE